MWCTVSGGKRYDNYDVKREGDVNVSLSKFSCNSQDLL